MISREAGGIASATGKTLGLAVSWSLPLCAGGMIGFGLVCLAIRAQWGDQTWSLFAADRFLNGARLGVDLWLVGPPLIVWLYELPVALGHRFGVPAVEALQASIFLLAAFSIAWSSMLVRRGPAGDGRVAGWFAIVMVFATIVHPWVHIGQREHILLLLVVPYLVMAAWRIDGKAPSPGEALAVGLLAGIGFLVKPHHLLVPAAIEALVLYRRRSLRLLFRPEAMALAATCVGYAIAVWLWAPDYLSKIVPMALATYYEYHRHALFELIRPMRALKLLIVLVVWAAMYRWLAHRALTCVLVVAGLAAIGAVVAQMKGHEYQFVPVLGFFDLLCGVMVIDGWLLATRRWTRPVPAGGAIAGTAAMVVAAVAIGYPLQRARAAHPYTDDRIAAQRAVGPYIPRGTTVLILSTSTETFFGEVLDRGWNWASRFDCLWMLPGIVHAEHAAATAHRDEPSAIREDAARVREAVAADLTLWRPMLVLVDRCQDASITPCMGIGHLRLDLLKWLDGGSGFAAAWSAYVPEGRIGPYDLWCSRDEVAKCRDILALANVRSGGPGW